MSRRAVLAEFDSADAILAAARNLRDHGIIAIDAYTPYAIPELEPLIVARRSIRPCIVLTGGGVGLLVGAAVQYLTSAVFYPLNIGGRPLAAWPAFGPILFESALIGAVLTGFLGFFVLVRLPRLYDRIFDAPDFARASSDRFFLEIQFDGRRDTRARLSRLLGDGKPIALHELRP